MDRQTWKALSRAARTIRRLRSGNGATKLGSATVKRCYVVDAITEDWVIKIPNNFESTDPDRLFAGLLSMEEEARVFHLLPPEARPRTAFLSDALWIQERAQPTAGFENHTIPLKLEAIGIGDHFDHNMGRTKDGREVLYDWGMARQYGEDRHRKFARAVARIRGVGPSEDLLSHDMFTMRRRSLDTARTSRTVAVVPQDGRLNFDG